jgi:hypothetical protein
VSAPLVRSPDGRTIYGTANNVNWLTDADLAMATADVWQLVFEARMSLVSSPDAASF